MIRKDLTGRSSANQGRTLWLQRQCNNPVGRCDYPDITARHKDYILDWPGGYTHNPLSWSVEQESKRYKLWIFIRKVEAIHG